MQEFYADLRAIPYFPHLTQCTEGGCAYTQQYLSLASLRKRLVALDAAATQTQIENPAWHQYPLGWQRHDLRLSAAAKPVSAATVFETRVRLFHVTRIVQQIPLLKYCYK